MQPVTSDKVEVRLATERFDAHRALECRGNALKCRTTLFASSRFPCLADGEIVDAAIAEANDAFKAWATAEQQDKGALPTPRIGRLCTMCLAWQRRE